ncbi:Bardet-Biedl syndrome 10 protein isoform X1 [Seriola aureovittata]|uniref:Bardet-Biedl syndrome 10 protein isoform X1 n=2 Tax=Seriola aureovittata TaxID=2871759 RepID=UPI0024BE530A|nr:Bardet-Biedl syndrome 10 protein isoform X1 [Seriola aureovittata]
MSVGMLPVEHFRLKHVLQAVCGLEAVVLRSFGPEGGQVLFTRDTGQAMLSRSGTRILTALRLEHPLARMVVECVWKHSTVTGDGSKTFILLLASLLRMIHTMACKEPNVSHTYNSREAAKAATARCLADELLAFALEEMDDLIAIGVVPYGFCDLWEDFTAETQSPAHTNNHGVQKLLASFFHTRLGQIHCDYISNLACQLLRHLKFKKDQPFLALQFVNDNFPALHTPVSGFPISCSRLIEGQVIHRDFAMPCARTDQQPVKAVVFTGYLQPQLVSAGDVLEVGCGNHMIAENSRKEKSIVEFSAWSERSLESVIANLQSLGVSVLLSAVKQSAAVMALAAQAEMCVVECISEDELSLFAQLSGTTPVSDCWIIETVNVATLTFCRPILLGVHRYVHVAFHDLEERVMVRPSSLVVCGPGEGQTDQYACAFQDAIRMLLTTCKPVGMTEATISKRTLQSQRSISLHTDDRSNKIAYNSFQQRVLVPSCVIPAGGTFEFLLNHALLHHGRSSSVSDSTNIPAVSQLLANVLLSVPQQIYSHSPQHFLQIQSRVMSFIPNNSHAFNLLYKQEHNISLVQDHVTSEFPLKDGKLSMHCCRKADMSSKIFMSDLGLESVSCKYELLLAVLQCVTSLLRVDTVLCTHTALHTQSRRLTNISWEGTEDEAED